MKKGNLLVACSFCTIPVMIYCIENNLSKHAMLGLCSAVFLIAYIVIGDIEEMVQNFKALKRRADIRKNICYASISVDNPYQEDPLNVEEEYSFLEDNND